MFGIMAVIKKLITRIFNERKKDRLFSNKIYFFIIITYIYLKIYRFIDYTLFSFYLSNFVHRDIIY